jgi:hypothetical protein
MFKKVQGFSKGSRLSVGSDDESDGDGDSDSSTLSHSDGESSAHSQEELTQPSNQKKLWSDEETAELIKALKGKGGVVDGKIQYDFLAGQLEDRDVESVRNKFNFWRKKMKKPNDNPNDKYYKQAQDVFRYVESTRKVIQSMYDYTLRFSMTSKNISPLPLNSPRAMNFPKICLHPPITARESGRQRRQCS